MTDYIKREDAMEIVKNNLSRFMISLRIGDCPSADVVPVVRCGDCLFCQMELGEGADEPWCDVHNTTVDTEMFCSWGIRKDDED